MGNLTPFGTSPFDILFKDFFKSDGDFTPFNTIKVQKIWWFGGHLTFVKNGV